MIERKALTFEKSRDIVRLGRHNDRLGVGPVQFEI